MSIALSLGNNLTTGGVFKASAVNNTSCNNITTFAGVTGGGTLVLLSTQTASASANISFTTGIDSTYNEYIFKFINIHPSTANAGFQFNGSTDGGSNYNVTKTTTTFRAFHNEDDRTPYLQYAGYDLAQSTSYQQITDADTGYLDSDMSTSGYLHLFDPSNTTYVKHFMSNVNYYGNNNWCINAFTAGYLNTTSAINAIDFQFNTGNIDDGIIKMYGVKKS